MAGLVEIILARKVWRRLAVLVLAAIVILCLSGVYRYGRDVKREIDLLAIANSDSQQWSLAQLEVEYNRMRVALLTIGNANSDLFQQRFDIFYSRLQTVLHGYAFESINTQLQSAEAIGQLRDFLDRTAEKVDSGKLLDRADFEQILREANALEHGIRTLSLQGMSVFVKNSKVQREEVFLALVKLSLLTGLLITLMCLAVVALSLMWRFGRAQTRSLHDTLVRLAAVVDTSLDAIIVADAQMRVIEFNSAAELIFKIDRAPALGRSLHDFVELGQAPVLGQGLVQRPGLRAHGAAFPAELSIQTAMIGQGLIHVVYLRDISARIAQERELVAARDRALAGERAKARFVAVISHELRTPLNGLLGMLDLIRTTDLSPLQSEYTEAMEHSGMVLLHHVNDVLDVERLDAGKLTFVKQPFKPLRLAQQIAQAQKMSAKRRGNDILVESESPLPDVLGDAARLRQIIVNLLGNAIKFTENGTIRLVLRYDQEEERLTIRVIDTGMGIAPEDRARIFEDFVTVDGAPNRDISGTGLGLGIVRRLIFAMGGNIGVDEAPGGGAAFWITLPATVAPAGEKKPSAKALVPVRDGPPLRILIVEDNALNRRVLQEMLRQGGHEIASATNGQEGVEAARKQRFDLILMDLNMPVLNGMAATKILRAQPGPNQHSAIVAVTANVLPKAVAELVEAGCDRVVSKPITRAILYQALGAADARAGIGTATPFPQKQTHG
ncbi:response regulator [Rhodobacteraceae bacterium]|nr:response regulator [Paracoccaceae bacterium]